ncbi:hypothetical protein YA0027_08915 [Pseudomonas syringae]|nr:hypothetical protein [Pseudomonas syringae]MBI6821863.1 hypothetical protein [Pseudomonas syringae]
MRGDKLAIQGKYSPCNHCKVMAHQAPKLLMPECR